MKRLLELHSIYNSELKKVFDEFEEEEESIYASMKEYVHLFEKKKYLEKKLEALEKEMVEEISEGLADE
jgi:hypothetical protein